MAWIGRRADPPRPGAARHLAPLVLLALAAGGCGEPGIDAPRRDREIAIDGSHREWEGALRVFEEEGVYVGFQHDGSNLYGCLATNRSNWALAALTAGLTVWIEPPGDAARRGLRFPVGAGRPDSGPDGRGLLPDPEFLVGDARSADRQVDLLLDGTPPRRLFVAQVPGFDAQCGYEDGVFAVEFRLPLRGVDADGISAGCDPGSRLRVIVETQPAAAPGARRGERGDRPDDPGGSGGGGGRGPGEGPPGRGRGGMGGGMGGHPGSPGGLKTLELAMRVRLVEGNAE